MTADMPNRQPTYAIPDTAPAHINGLVEHAPDAAVADPVRNVLALPDLTGLTAGDAEYFEGMAAAKRRSANGSETVWAASARAEAAGLEALAAAVRDPVAREMPVLRQGRGGETAPPESGDHPWHVRELEQAVETPAAVLAADASMDRLRLARDARVLNGAVELAEDVGAANAGERMLAHQLATAHRTAMRLFIAVDRDMDRHQASASLYPGALLEAQRSAAVGARVLSSFAQGMLALDRLRNGNRQVVVVQHTTVNDGGQAVVAGTVAPGGSSAVPAVSHRGRRRK